MIIGNNKKKLLIVGAFSKKYPPSQPHLRAMT